MRTSALICLLAVVWLVSPIVHAEAPIQVAGELRGQTIGRQVDVLEDANGALQIGQVSSPAFASRFQPSSSDAPNFGFSKASYWFRLEVGNSAERVRSWLLEVGYPHLDQVTLYVPLPQGGFVARETGDTLPFSRRDLAYRNFLFTLEEPAHSQRTYYLRVASSSALNIPLTAWTTTQFVEHQHLDWAVLCAFYGIVLIMAFYNACIYVLARQADFIRYVWFVLALGLMQLTLAGHTFQYLLPNHSWLAGRVLPASISLLVLTSCDFATNYLGRTTCHRTFTLCSRLAAALMVASFLVPYALTIRLLVPIAIGACLTGMVAAFLNMRHGDRRGKLYAMAWGVFLLGAMGTMLKAWGVLPINFLTNWSMQLGAVLQLALLSSMLADNINVMRADLKALNGKLSDQVDALREALTRAEEATCRAEKATRVKDEFMATMSHEFRTPLNAIINIPQGLLDYFPTFRGAACSKCTSTFELDEGEQLEPGTACPDCGELGGLREESMRRYVGEASHTASYLGKIERSGQHLLQVVNGILDFSKLESGHFELSREEIAMNSLLSDVIEQMSGLAEAAQVQLELVSSEANAVLYADELRMRQVLINLLGNAIKFSRPGGKVSLEVSSQANAYLFVVRDQGIGIAKENFETIFTSFEQVHKGNTRRYGGTGLGLSIARSLVQMHHGEMWVESTLGQGSAFHFRIPRESPAKRPQGRAPATQTEEDSLTEETWA